MAKTKKSERLTPIPAYKSGERTRAAKEHCQSISRAPQPPAEPDLSHITPDLWPLAKPLSDIAFLADNAVDHSEDQIADLKALLTQRGQLEPLVVNTRPTPWVVIGGNGRLAAMLSLGWLHAAIVTVDLDDATAAQISLELNGATEGRTWNKERLAAMQERIQAAKVQLSERVHGMMAKLRERHGMTIALPSAPDPGPEVDRAAELQKKWKTAIGQTWQIGRHRVHCGDCFEVEAELVEGVCTDPPYDMKPDHILEVLARWSDGAVVLCGGSGIMAANLVTGGWEPKLLLCWHHKTPWSVPGGRLPLIYHGLGVFLARNDSKLNWQRPRPDFGSIIFSNYERMDGHGQAKSIYLFAELLAGLSWKTVCDPFAGTLPVLLACEQQGRRFVGCELDPMLLAVGLERCKDLSPQALDL